MLKIWVLLWIRSVIFGLILCLSHLNVQYLGFNVKLLLFYKYSKPDIHQSRGRAKIVKEKRWKKTIIVTKTSLDEKCAKIYGGVWISWQKMLSWYKLYVKRSKTNHFYKYNICQAILPFWGGYYCHITVSIVFLSFFFFLVNAYSRNWKHMVPIRPWKIFYLLALTSYKQSGAYFHLLLTVEISVDQNWVQLIQRAFWARLVAKDLDCNVFLDSSVLVIVKISKLVQNF